MSPMPELYFDDCMNASTSLAKLEQKTNASSTPEASRNSSTYAIIGVVPAIGKSTLGRCREMGLHVFG